MLTNMANHLIYAATTSVIIILIIIIPSLLILNVYAVDAFGAVGHRHNPDERTQRAPNQRSSQSQPVCVNVPKNLSFCETFGWGNKMRLPNLLEHESVHEVQLHASTWQQLHSTRCSPDLSLFLCSVISPVCLDVIVPPCRSLCLSVKGSCEPIMKRHGHNWPRVIDCNKFPINKDMCISRQTVHDPSQDNKDNEMTNNDYNNNNSNSNNNNSKNNNGSRQNLNIAPQVEDANSNKRRKGKKNRTSTRKNTTSTTPISLSTSSYESDRSSLDKHGSLPKSSMSISITETTVPIISSITVAPISNISIYANETNHPMNQSNVDFIQLFCSTHSEWIIKTRITDSQLFRAQDKRKLKLRSYKQIYGQASGSSARGKKNLPQLVVYLTNGTLALTHNQSSVQVNLFDNLLAGSPVSSPTTDIGAGSPQSSQASITRHEKSQLYLLTGKTSPNQQRQITMWMLWPKKETEGNQTKEERLSNMNQSLLRAYKDIKKKDAKVCNKFPSQSTKKSSSTSFKQVEITNRNHNRFADN